MHDYPSELVHPGEILENILATRAIVKTDFANVVGLANEVLDDFLAGKIRVTPEFATKFSDFFGNSVDMWLGLQEDFDKRNQKQV